MFGTAAREQRVQEKARELDRRIKSLRERRDPTGTEEAEVAALHREARQLYDEAEAIKNEKATMDQIRELGAGLGLDDDEWGSGHSGGPLVAGKEQSPKLKAVGGSNWGATLVRRHTDAYGAFKSLTPSGQVNVTVPLNPESVRDGVPVAVLRQLVPSTEDTVGRFSFLRQTLRDNQAAAVARGARKPTSRYELTRVDDRSRTLAHLSEPVARQDLADADLLQSFLDDEMRLGVEQELEAQIISGDGTGENFEGLATVSGTQAQAWDTDVLTTTRKAITRLEALSLSGSGWVLHPNDWEAAELAAAEQYASNSNIRAPVERVARRLWGVPVAVSTAATAGVGHLADFAGSTRLWMRQDATIDWSEGLYSADKFGAGVGGTLFEANEIVFRCEGRFGFAVTRPPGVVEVDLTAV